MCRPAALGILTVGTIIMICAVALPHWRNSSETSLLSAFGFHSKWQGLWQSCEENFLGIASGCGPYGGTIPLIIACRAFCVLAITFTILAIFAMAFGMTSGGTTDKRRVRMVAGGMACFSAVLVIGSASLYANSINNEGVIPQSGKGNFIGEAVNNALFKWEFGICLYLAWISGIIVNIGGCIAICTGCQDDQVQRTQNQSYEPTNQVIVV